MEISVGIEGKGEMVVGQEHCALQVGSGSVEVFSTPSLLAFMEKVAHQSILAYLGDDCISVGTEVNLRHYKASGIGAKLHATSLLQKVEGRMLYFKIEVQQEDVLIADGMHMRAIVQRKKFLSRLL